MTTSLLDLARGPLFHWALIVMIIGLVWRLSGLIFFRGQSQAAEPKPGNPIAAGLRTVALRSVPPHELEKNITFQHLTGYAWHIGWFVTFLFLGVHLPLIKSILGFAVGNTCAQNSAVLFCISAIGYVPALTISITSPGSITGSASRATAGCLP